MRFSLFSWFPPVLVEIYDRYEIWTATESELSNGDSPADNLSTDAADYRTKVSIVLGRKRNV